MFIYRVHEKGGAMYMFKKHKKDAAMFIFRVHEKSDAMYMLKMHKKEAAMFIFRVHEKGGATDKLLYNISGLIVLIGFVEWCRYVNCATEKNLLKKKVHFLLRHCY